MKRYIYSRCSTDAQDFNQQMKCITDYLYRNGLRDSDIAAIYKEKVSGRVKHTERQLSDLISACSAGDYIYISELSRLGRNMTDLYNIVSECCDKDIIIIQCKDGTQIENRSIAGKSLLFALSLASEIELENIRQRTLMGLAACKQAILEHGGFISKRSGRWTTHLGGTPEGSAFNRAHIDAASESRQKVAQKRRVESPGYRWVVRKINEGWTNKQIIEEFNLNHSLGIEGFSAPNGGEMTRCVLHRWKAAMELDKDLI